MQQSLQNPADVYRPVQLSLSLDHSTAARMKYRKVDPSELDGAVYCSELKNLMNNVSFLTEKALLGDTVVYIGNTIGAWIQTVTSMFPTLRFVVYDGNPTRVQLDMAARASGHAADRARSNTLFNHTWFSTAEADRLVRTQFPSYDPGKTLLIAETRNVVAQQHVQEDDGLQASEKKDLEGEGEGGLGGVFIAKDVLKDMADQDSWVHVLKPRGTLVRFMLPYQDSHSYSYMHGELRLQPFAARNSSEVRLSVDMQPGSEMYPRQVYDSEKHDECMFYHNTVTRTQHMQSSLRIKVSVVVMFFACTGELV
jgi:hypothetical protein